MASITEKNENEKHTLQDLEYGKKLRNVENEKKNTVGPGIWQEILKNVENQKCTLQDLEYGEKNKTGPGL